MTTPDKADKAVEAGLEAAAQRPTDSAQDPLGRVELLAKDGRSARILAKAEADRVRAVASTAAQDAEAARAHRAELAHLQAQEIEAERRRRKASARSARRAEAGARLGGWAATAVAQIRSEAAASYAAVIYLIVVTVAVGSQFVLFKGLIEGNASLGTLRPVADLAALLAAVFVEGFGLAFYATSVASRLRGRGGWVPRVAAWGVTGFAAKMQYEAHKDLLVAGAPLLSYALAAASLGAMLLAEVRTTYQVGERLEALDQKDRPQARLGVKFCLRYRRQAWWAFSAMIAMPSVRTRTQALRAGRRMAHLHRRAQLNAYLMREAERALRSAQGRHGTSEAVLCRLQELAHLGLEGLALQAELASVADQPVKADEAEAHAVHAEPRPRPTPRKAAASTAQAEEKAEDVGRASKPSFAQWAEANGWASRPGGLEVWTQRVAFLASVYPAAIPGRQTIIDAMKLRLMDPDLPNPRHSWTNKEHVGWAMSDLKALRAESYLDPTLTDATVTA